jgi:hypothetical protein
MVPNDPDIHSSLEKTPNWIKSYICVVIIYLNIYHQKPAPTRLNFTHFSENPLNIWFSVTTLEIGWSSSVTTKWVQVETLW